MNRNFFQWNSLKTRVTLFALAIFVVGIWSVAFYASRTLRADMQRLLGDQQFSMVSLLAAQVDNDIDERVKALELVAAHITPAMLNKPADLQAFLEQRPVFQKQFNTGVIALRADGVAIAEVPRSGRIGVNYLDRDHVAAALKKGVTAIGRPAIGRVLKAPLIAISAPIFDARGKVIGAFTAGINLILPNMLGTIMEKHYGRNGGYLLLAPQERLIVTASDKRHIMEALPAAGILPAMDRFLQGYEGSAVYVDATGVEVLASAVRIPVGGWIMMAVLPTAEAFAPIDDVQRRMVWATLFVTLLAGVLTWWMLRRQLAPMLTAVRTLAHMSDTSQSSRSLPITRQDEIGELVGGFNRLLKMLAQREAALQASERRSYATFDQAAVGIVHTAIDGIYLRANQKFCDMLGYSESELVGRAASDFSHPEDRELGKQYRQQLWDSKIDKFAEEKRYLHKSGSVIWTNRTVSVARDDSGKPLHFIRVIEDITERKRLEDQVRQLAFYDTLTNLPNRRLLIDRLSQCMTASRRNGRYGALMFLDLDNFKLINDAYGHGVGDRLLIEVARRIGGCVRETDTVARFGGDEFVVMLSGLDPDISASATMAGAIAEKIRTALAQPYVLTIKPEGETETTVERHCTASIGLALFISLEADVEDLLKWADTAMYQAKEAGRNSIQFYDSKAGVTA